MKILKSLATLLVLPLFLLGGVTIAQNLFDGNIVPSIIGLVFVVVSVLLGVFVFATETIAPYYKSQTVRAKIHRAVYDYLVSKGYDTDVAYRLATKVTRWQ